MHISIRAIAALPLLALMAATVAGWWPAGGSAAETPVRIGYQRNGSLLLLKESGALEPTLKASGVSVEWREFSGGPQLLEAMNAGAIDFGVTGEAPPIFAQAAGAPLVYVGVEPPAPQGEAIIVPKDSPLRSIADLKGKKIALNKESNVHYLLVRALEEAGLSYGDIQPVYLAPADARAAFERGAIDAWAIWDPYYAAAVAATGARILADGSNLVPNHQFFLASRSLSDRRRPVVDAILQGLKAIEADALVHPAEIARRMAAATGIPAPILETALRRFSYGIQPLGPEVVAEQQKIADTFESLGLIPRHISIADALPGTGS